MISRYPSSHSRWRRPRLVLTLATVGVLSLAGCGGDEPSEATPTPSSSGSTPEASASASPSSAGPSSGSASADPSPSVTPATGTTYRRQTFSFTLPPEFTANGDVGNGVLRTADFGAQQLGCYFSVAEVGGADIIGADLEDAASQALKTSKGTMTRQPDREVGGRPVYVLTGSDATSPEKYEVGRVAGTKTATINFAFFTASPDNQRLVDSILATVQWND